MADAPPRTRGIAWAGGINLLGGATGSMVSLVLAAVVGRQLGTTGAGTYFLVVAVFMIVSNVGELGSDTGLVRFISMARATGRDAEIPALIRAAFVPVLTVGVVVVGGAGLLVWTAPALLPDLPPGLVLGAVSCALLSSLVALTLAVVRGFGDVSTYPLLQNVTLPLLRLGAIAGVLLAGAGVTGVLVAWMVPVPLVLMAGIYVALRLLRDGARSLPQHQLCMAQKRAVSREFWRFSAARGAAAAVEIMLEWADVLLVGVLTSPTEAGIYAVASRCARGGEVVQQAARVAVGPVISAALARREVVAVKDMYGLVTAVMIWVAWPFYLVLAIFGDAIMTLFGQDFSTGAPALATLSLAMAVATAAGAVQTILLMGGRGSWQLADKSIVLVINLALVLVLVPVWGIVGAAAAWAVAIVIDTALVVWQVQGLMGLRPRLRHITHAAGVAALFAGVPLGASRMVFGPSISVLVWSLLLVVPMYLAVGWLLRSQLGLTQIVEHRGGAEPATRPAR